MSPRRKTIISTGNVYHIFSRSIAKFVIFNDDKEFDRIFALINLHRYRDFSYKYSKFLEFSPITREMIINKLTQENNFLVDIIAYCLMPTHVHLVLKQNVDDGICTFISSVLNSYSKYFNTKHQRMGPLWSSRFKSVLVLDDEQLLHLTRYLHLNPTSAGLVNKSENWQYSSYNEYLDNKEEDGICNFKDFISIKPKQYRKFVEDRKDYQKQLSLIKYLTIDDYSD